MRMVTWAPISLSILELHRISVAQLIKVQSLHREPKLLMIH